MWEINVFKLSVVKVKFIVQIKCSYSIIKNLFSYLIIKYSYEYEYSTTTDHVKCHSIIRL